MRSDKTAFEYKRTVQPLPKLGPWREELDRLLAANAARGSRERVTVLRIFEVEGRSAIGSRNAPTPGARLQRQV